MLGGVTYEEARYVAEMNQANPGVRILLGGTCVHNCSTFLRELSRMDVQAARPASMVGHSGEGARARNGDRGGGQHQRRMSGNLRKRLADQHGMSFRAGRHTAANRVPEWLQILERILNHQKPFPTV